jgi:hypothetical protein
MRLWVNKIIIHIVENLFPWQIILQFVDKQIVNVAPIKCQRFLFQTLICWIVL